MRRATARAQAQGRRLGVRQAEAQLGASRNDRRGNIQRQFARAGVRTPRNASYMGAS